MSWSIDNGRRRRSAGAASILASALIAGIAVSGTTAGGRATGGDALYWTANGKRIVYETGTSLGMVDANGQHKRAFPGRSEDVAISPGGGMLARFIDQSGSRRRLVLKTLEGKRVRKFIVRARRPGDIIDGPTWAPDESAVAFIYDQVGIFVADRRKGVRLLVRGDFDYYALRPAWSPDSQQILVEPCPSACHYTVIRRNGSHARVVARGTNPEDPWAIASPVAPWSPDRRWLAFARKHAVYLVHPDGSGERRVTTGGAYRIVWSADGRRLAYIGPKGISVVRIRGGTPHRLTTRIGQRGIAWAPAKRIVYSHRGVIWTVSPGQRPVAIK
jgi:Tol biopolymer transport system component